MQSSPTLTSGTVWHFSKQSCIGSLDYLFVDEAGQVSLANAIASAPAARNIVLLGDPMQLPHVTQGSHEAGAGRSVLEHLLGDCATVRPDRRDPARHLVPNAAGNLFLHLGLDVRFTVRPDARTAANAVEGRGISGAGLRFVSVDHVGEHATVARGGGADRPGDPQSARGTVCVNGAPPRTLVAGDILVVTPYNAQRRLIDDTLREARITGIRVGTVDKFQGQEAPVVFYSMTTSSADDIPRSMEFLFDRNRFNVAVSRAQCLSVLVCSPRLLGFRCNHVEQMELVNLLCAFAERAESGEDAACVAPPAA